MRISDWSSDVCSSDLQSNGLGASSSCGSSRPSRVAIWLKWPSTASVAEVNIHAAREASRCARSGPDTSSGVRCRRKRSEEHPSELQSPMRISYAVFCLKKQTLTPPTSHPYHRAPHLQPTHINYL